MAETLNPESSILNPVLFPLDAPERVIVFERIGGGLLRHIFRRPTDDDAREFFRALQLAADKTRAGEKVDALKPKRDFYARLAVNAEGYPPVKGHAGKYSEFTPAPVALDGKSMARTWHDLVPQAHRLRAVDELAFCDLTRGGIAEVDPDFEAVSLDARGYSPEGKMLQYSGLIHRFEPFTEEDRMKFEVECNRTTVVGGSRSGLTLQVPRSNVCLRLYDRKIRAVEGYSVNGRALQDVEEIRHWMDPFHKVGAIAPLISEWTLDLKRPGEAEPSDEDLARQMAEVEAREEE